MITSIFRWKLISILLVYFWKNASILTIVGKILSPSTGISEWNKFVIAILLF